MTGPLKTIGVATLITASVLGFVNWRAHAHRSNKVTHGVVTADPSDSMTVDRAGVIGLAERALNQLNMSPGSILTVIALGDDRTGNEPRLIAKYDVPYSHRALEGKGQVARRKSEILSDLKGRLQNLPRTKRSPIFLALKRAIEQQRASGCTSDSDCYIFIRTDGEETQERSIKAAIEGVGPRKNLPHLSNEGMRIVFCGLAETNSGMSTDVQKRQALYDPRRSDRLQEVWRSVSSMPSLVTFEPYCFGHELVQR